MPATATATATATSLFLCVTTYRLMPRIIAHHYFSFLFFIYNPTPRTYWVSENTIDFREINLSIMDTETGYIQKQFMWIT